eukprot:15337886-Ditylum_brightwellii.AAC.1
MMIVAVVVVVVVVVAVVDIHKADAVVVADQPDYWHGIAIAADVMVVVVIGGGGEVVASPMEVVFKCDDDGGMIIIGKVVGMMIILSIIIAIGFSFVIATNYKARANTTRTSANITLFSTAAPCSTGSN